MYGMFFIAALLLASTAFTTRLVQATTAQHEAAVVKVLSEQLAAYGYYVEQFASANPTLVGEMDAAGLGLPAWFKPDSALRHYIDNGAAYVYLVPATPAQGFAMARGLAVPDRVGLAIDGALQPAGGGAATVALPAAIPAGALVLVM